MSRVSVCLTHYNRRHKLAATLESLAQQTRVPDEVFVWDDCSPDDPADIVQAFRHRFPQFRYHRNSRNLGMPGNLNAVIAHATGDYIANLHDADVFHPELLEKWTRVLDKYPSAGLAFCGLDATRDNPAGSTMPLPEVDPITTGREFFGRWFVGRENSIIWGTVMARKAAYDRLLPFDPVYRNWSDVDMWMRMCQEFDVAYVAEPLIVLDNTATPQRRFSWYRVLLMQEICFANIRRIHARDAVALRVALQRQRRTLRLGYCRLLLGSLKWFDWARLREGIALAARIFSADATSGKGRLMEGLVPTA